MTWYTLLTTVAMTVLFWSAVDARIGLWRLDASIRRDRSHITRIRLSTQAKSTSVDEHLISWSAYAGQLDTVLLPVIRAIRDRRPIDAAALDQVETEILAAPMVRASSVAQIAPGVGLLFSAASLSVGLLGTAGDPTEAARTLIAVLPVALLSTVASLALSIWLTASLSRTMQNWHGLRADFGAIDDPVHRAAPSLKVAAE